MSSLPPPLFSLCPGLALFDFPHQRHESEGIEGLTRERRKKSGVVLML
jgi:hypothetical protein